MKSTSRISAGGIATTTCRAATATPSAVTVTWPSRCSIARTGTPSRTASPSSSATFIAIDPVPPSTRFSCVPFSIEKSTLRPPWARTSQSRWRNEMSSRLPVMSPEIALSKSSRATPSSHARPPEPVGDGTGIPFGGARRGPRLVERHLLREVVDPALRLDDRRHRDRADLRDQAGVAAHPGAVDEQVRARDVRLVRGRADFGREPEDGVVLRCEPRTAAVHQDLVVDERGPDPTADPVARLQHRDRATCLLQTACRGQARVPRAHHAHVDIDALGHERGTYRTRGCRAGNGAC